MVALRLEICSFCDAPTWCRDTVPGAKAKPICRACDVEKFFENVLYKPIGFSLIGWQREALREVYGTVHAENGRRRYDSAYLEVAKKNGKSFLIGGLPLYHLVREGVVNPKAYGAAAAKDQAGLVFAAAAQLYRKNPMLQQVLKLVESTKRIVRRDGAGYYQVVAADGDVQDGVEPTLTLMDELHRWKTAKARTLYQVLTAGDISVEEPLRWQITTAGDRYESEICWTAHERAQQIIDGRLKSDTFFARVYQCDRKKLAADKEYWRTREARADANPSHEDHGGFLRDDKIASKLEELGEVAYKRLHLNIWNQREEHWMPADAWGKCGQPLRALVGRPCWIGVDLSKNTDFTALVAIYQQEDGSIDIQPTFWIPEEQVHKLERKLRIDLQRWINQGLLRTTPGPAIQFDAIKRQIATIAEAAELREVCYDPRFAWQVISELEADGYTCVEVQQTANKLDAPMQWLMKAVLEGSVRHGSHEVMDWMTQCVSVRVSKDGLIQPDKQYLARDSKRIDGISALLTGLVRVILHESSEIGVFCANLG
jgi:phage terminase large subunit-like protein